MTNTMIEMLTAPFGLSQQTDSIPWSDEETATLQAKLWSLLERQAKRKTQGDSSSLRAEDADELIESIRFTLRLYLDRYCLSERVLLTEDIHALFYTAQRTVEACLDETRALYEKALGTVRTLGSRSLTDTLRGIAPFFSAYDLRLYAHRIPADIDYQLSQPVAEMLCGVSYLREYLLRLLTENDLILRFDADREIALLRRASPDYRALLQNLYEPVAACMIGLSLLGGGETLMEVTPSQGDRIAAMFTGISSAEGNAMLRAAVDGACDRLQLNSAFLRRYLMGTAASLYPRIIASPESVRGVFSMDREAFVTFVNGA